MVAYIPIIEWFHGIDVLIDVFSLIVLLLLAFNILRFYLIKKKERAADAKFLKLEKSNGYEDKRYRLFITSFFLLSLSFVFKLFTYFVIQYEAVETKHIGMLTITYQTVKNSDATILWGFFFFRVLSLLAFYLLYLAYTRKELKITENNPGKSGITFRNSFGMLFVLYLLLMASYYSQSVYYVYYTTCFFLLFIIAETVYEIYSVNKHVNTLLLTIAFGIIMISHGIFLFLKVQSWMYVIAETVQLVGYSLLLITFLRIMFPKKLVQAGKDKHNIRIEDIVSEDPMAMGSVKSVRSAKRQSSLKDSPVDGSRTKSSSKKSSTRSRSRSKVKVR